MPHGPDVCPGTRLAVWPREAFMQHQETETLDRRILASFREGLPDGAPDIASMLIDQFLEEAASQGEALRTAGQRGDAAGLKSAAHSLRGSSMTMGAMRLGSLCTAVESHAGRPAPSGDATTLMLELLGEIERELVNVRGALLVEREGVSQS